MHLISTKFGTQKKLNILTINSLIGTDVLDQKLQICKISSQNEKVLQFLWKLGFTANVTC